MLMWTMEVEGMVAHCFYEQNSKKFRVEVSYEGKRLVETFRSSFAPVFGMDIVDDQRSRQIAEELALKLESKKKNKNLVNNFYCYGLRSDFMEVKKKLQEMGMKISGSETKDLSNLVLISSQKENKLEIKLDILEGLYKGLVGVMVLQYEDGPSSLGYLLSLKGFNLEFQGSSGGFDATNFYLLHSDKNKNKVLKRLSKNKDLLEKNLKKIDNK